MHALRTTCFTLMLATGLPIAAMAAPMQVDFNVAGFAGPTSGTMSTFTKHHVGGVDLTFDAFEDGGSGQAALFGAPSLYWDANDGLGHGDGFGVMGSGYSGDEIEGNERLRLTFSKAVHLLGFNLTDFFDEREPNDLDCQNGTPNCYVERGAYMLLFGDGTTSDWNWFSASLGAVRTGNGVFDVALDFEDVVGLMFRAPGEVDGAFSVPFQELHEFSLAGVRFDDPPSTVPEPASCGLVALGLSAIAVRRRRRA
jgi:PEP-CTERM motif